MLVDSIRKAAIKDVALAAITPPCRWPQGHAHRPNCQCKASSNPLARAALDLLTEVERLERQVKELQGTDDFHGGGLGWERDIG